MKHGHHDTIPSPLLYGGGVTKERVKWVDTCVAFTSRYRRCDRPAVERVAGYWHCAQHAKRAKRVRRVVGFRKATEGRS